MSSIRPSAIVRSAWLELLYRAAMTTPWLVRELKPILTASGWLFSNPLRHAVMSNARHLLGPGATGHDCRVLARRIIGNAFDALAELGAGIQRPVDSLRRECGEVIGEQRYREARSLRRGAVLATAHLGPFEHAIAMLTEREKNVHVVFRRDRSVGFERLRRAQHARFGVHEAPIDEGLPMWLRLRDALASDHVVLMQADRTLPGQPGVVVPFLGGHVALPAGPVKLARLAKAPLIPVVAAWSGDRRVRIKLEPPVTVEAQPPPRSAIDPAMLTMARILERWVREYPDQWLCLHAAWLENQVSRTVEEESGTLKAWMRLHPS